MENKATTMKLKFEEMFPSANDVGTYKNEIPFLHPSDVQDILDHIREFSIQKQVSEDQEEWDQNQIASMLLKGYIPTAIAPAVESIRLGIKKLNCERQENKNFLELGCGAGWSSLIMITELLRAGYKNFNLIIIDKSMHSIKTAQLLLEKFQISTYHIAAVDEIDNRKDQGMKIYFLRGDFLQALQKLDLQFTLIWSNFGVSYLLDDVFFTLLKQIKQKLKIQGVCVIDALNTEYQMQLNIIILFKRIIFGGNRNYKSPLVDKQIKNDGKIIITESNASISMCLYDYLHWLLFNDLNSFIFLIKAISRGTSMVEEYAPSNHIRIISDSSALKIFKDVNKSSLLINTTILVKKEN